MDSNPEYKELEALFPGETFKLSNTGEEVVVKQVTFGKLRVFIDAVSSLMQKLEAVGVKNIEDPSSWPIVFATAHGEVIRIMSAILNKPPEWFDDVLMPADGLHLFGMILQQNVNNDLKKKFQDLAKLFRSVMSTSPSS